MRSEIRTLRETQLATRALKADLERLHMSPASVIGQTFAAEYLHRARTALRQAERTFAKADLCSGSFELVRQLPARGRKPA